jgi:FKBP-type peptidyl-prolyl cis-trans isomerase (trigger factor)
MILDELILQEIYAGYGIPEIPNWMIENRLKVALKAVEDDLQKHGIKRNNVEYNETINKTRKEVLTYFRELSKEKVRAKQREKIKAYMKKKISI